MKRSTPSASDERWEACESSMLEFVRRLGQRVAMRAHDNDARIVVHRLVVIDRVGG
jgi:hypothetical protein